MDPKERDPKLDQQLDQWLDDALAGYSAAEPRPGLEQRITAHLRAEERQPQPRRWWLLLTPASAAIAIIVVAVAFNQHRAPSSISEAPKPSQSQQISSYIDSNATQTEAQQDRDKLETPSRAKASRTETSTFNQLAANAPHRKLTPKPAQSPDLRASAGLAKSAPAYRADLNADAKSAVTAFGPRVANKTAAPALNITAAQTAQSYKNEAPAPTPAGVIGGLVDRAPSAPAAAMAREPRPEPASQESVRNSAPVVPSVNETVEVSAAAPVVETLTASAISANARAAAMPRTAARNQFPSPTPLTTEERLALSARGAAKPLPPLTPRDEPLPLLQIHEIKIDPLQDSEK